MKQPLQERLQSVQRDIGLIITEFDCGNNIQNRVEALKSAVQGISVVKRELDAIKDDIQKVLKSHQAICNCNRQ